MSYSNPTSICYRFPAAAIDTDGSIGSIIGPSGMQGRLIDIGYVVTVGTTDAASQINVGIVGGDEDAYGFISVPIASAGAVGNGMTRGADADEVIAADSGVSVFSDGGATAGDGDILVTIDWYGTSNR